MEWLWLFLGVAGLALLWLLIVGMERLSERLKVHDEMRRRNTKRIAEQTAEAEAEFMRQQYIKAGAKDFIENADLNDTNEEVLQEAIGALNSDELIDAVAKRMFGAPEGTDGITADQSALAQTPVRKVVAKGEGVMPVKVKPSSKSALSKSEQKMLKKIKQGY